MAIKPCIASQCRQQIAKTGVSGRIEERDLQHIREGAPGGSEERVSRAQPSINQERKAWQKDRRILSTFSSPK